MRVLLLVAFISAAGLTVAPPDHRDRVGNGLVPVAVTLPVGSSAALEPVDLEVMDDGRTVIPSAVVTGEPPALAILVDVATGESAKVGQLLDMVDDTLGRILIEASPIRYVNQFNIRRTNGVNAFMRAPENRTVPFGGRWRRADRPSWNAADWALASLQLRRSRRVLIVVTDGIRNPSLIPYHPDPGTGRQASFGDFHDRVRQEFATVFAVGVEGAKLSDDLRKTAAESGGDARSVGPGEDLRAVLTGLAEQIGNQRVVYFSPANPDGRVHQLQVRLKAGAVPLQAPTVYLAPRPQR